jgi:hypothetical protein
MKLSFLLLSLGVAVAAVAQAQPAPEVFISVRGVDNRTASVGEPVFVAVRVEAPAGATTFRLAPGKASWTDAVTVELTGPAGTLRGAATATGPAELTLGPDAAASGVWYFSSAGTTGLAPGTYQVRAKLDAGGAAGAPGAGESPAVPLTMVAASAAGGVQRAVALAAEFFLKGQPEEAVKLVDPLLEREPDNSRLLAARARACALGGDWVGAALCIERGLAKASAGKGYPPIELSQMQQELWARSREPAGAFTAPPAWTKLPERLLVRDWEQAPAAVPAKK